MLFPFHFVHCGWLDHNHVLSFRWYATNAFHSIHDHFGPSCPPSSILTVPPRALLITYFSAPDPSLPPTLISFQAAGQLKSCDGTEWDGVDTGLAVNTEDQQNT